MSEKQNLEISVTHCPDGRDLIEVTLELSGKTYAARRTSAGHMSQEELQLFARIFQVLLEEKIRLAIREMVDDSILGCTDPLQNSSDCVKPSFFCGCLFKKLP